MNIHQSRLHPILFHYDARLRRHYQFAYVVELELSLHDLAADVCEFVVLGLASDYLCQVPYHEVFSEPAHNKHFFAGFSFVELGGYHLEVVNFAEL